MPGSISACSNMTAWMWAADRELRARPLASLLITRALFAAYAASSGSPRANRCLGTVARAAATGSDMTASISRSSRTMAARSEAALSAASMGGVVISASFTG